MSNRNNLLAVLIILIILFIVILVFLFSVLQVSGDERSKKRYSSDSNYEYLNNESSGNEYVPIDFEILGNNRSGSGGGGGGKKNECDDDQIIVRLFRGENTHAALWNETIYEEEVCYNEIFGEMYDGRNPQECDGDNLVLRLIKEFNSHVEAPDALIHDLEYGIDLCYGDLECVTRSGTCVGNEKEIVSLADYNNAHLEDRDVNDYNLLVCCTSSN